MKNIRRKIMLVAVLLVFLWNISAWFIAKNYYIGRIQEIVAQKTALSRVRAGDLTDSIQRNLNYLHGIPDLLSQLLRVKNAVSRFGPDASPSSLPLEVRKKHWTEDVQLNELSRYFTLAEVSLNADIIYVVNAAGDCIAASNWGKPGSTIGTNFADRDFFQKNRNGQPGMQYAVGKTTHIPGLYFSTPVIIDGHFMGAVVAKTDVPNLSFLMNELDAFVVDENGVIILARDKQMEMRSLPGAPVSGMPEQKSFARYRKSDFPVFQMAPWGDREFPSLIRIQNERSPHIFFSTGIPQYGMKVYVGAEVDEFSSLTRDALWFAFLLGISGSILILMVGGGILYVASVKATKVALSRARMAERRIISLSEDTQQQIGRELHDDLGQLLSGVAFLSEVLFKRLAKEGGADAQEASKITAFINEAVSKTRHLAQGLYPVELKQAGLSAMLNNLAKNTAAMYPIKCEFICESECRINDPLVVINLFRIAQEAINNAVKHGEPSRITLKLAAESTVVTLEISDDGSGINNQEESDTEEGLGMHSMQYRASLLGGTLRVAPLSGGGTSVTVSFPV